MSQETCLVYGSQTFGGKACSDSLHICRPLFVLLEAIPLEGMASFFVCNIDAKGVWICGTGDVPAGKGRSARTCR